jgi:hypothetical protein
MLRIHPPPRSLLRFLPFLRPLPHSPYIHLPSPVDRAPHTRPCFVPCPLYVHTHIFSLPSPRPAFSSSVPSAFLLCPASPPIPHLLFLSLPIGGGYDLTTKPWSM